MSITIRKQLAPYWFKLDDKDPQSAEFQIKPLTQLQFIDVQNEGSLRKGRVILTGDGINVALTHGLIGWRGVIDCDGKDIEMTSEAIAGLPHNVLRAIAGEIISASFLDDAAKKNS